MPARTNRYCVCVDDNGAPREINRSGAVVTYKAIDYQSGNPVALQAIPLSNMDEGARRQFEEQVRAAQKLDHVNIARVDDLRSEGDHLVFVSEYLPGETAESWLLAHGPMPVDAVLRIGLQVVDALANVTFHNFTHRAIQPSNLMIVPGTAPDGGWPFVKLTNFGLAGLQLYEKATTELFPTITPAFASPEQLENGKIDFRSEVFSLGATMCFLLSGAVPLLGKPRRDGVADRFVPRMPGMPRHVRKLLQQMLRTDREQRPPDPITLTQQMQASLRRVEGRRSYAVPFSPAVERTTAPDNDLVTSSPSRWLAPALAAALIFFLLGGAALTIYPGQIRAFLQRNRPVANLGQPIGVPEGNAPPSFSPAEVAERDSGTSRLNEDTPPVPQPTVPAAQPSATVVAALPRQSPPISKPVEIAPTPAASPAVAADRRPIERPVEEPSPPAEGPREAPVVVAQVSPTPPRNFSDQTFWGRASRQNQPEGVASAPASPPDQAEGTDEPIASTQKPPLLKSTPANAKNTRTVSSRRRGNTPPLRVGQQQAEFVGTNRNGNWVLRLPSGETVVTPPAPNPLDAPVERHGRVRRVQIPPHALPADNETPEVVLPPSH